MAKVTFELPDFPIYMEISLCPYDSSSGEKRNERKVYASILPGDVLFITPVFDDIPKNT